MPDPTIVFLVAPTEASASSVSGLYDTLMAAGRDWQFLVTGEDPAPIFDVKLIGPPHGPNQQSSGLTILPDLTFETTDRPDIIIVPGLTLSPFERLNPDDHPALPWLRDQADQGTRIVSACSGAIYLAEIGLLDGIEATTHWAFEDLFRWHYPNVRLRLDLGLCFSRADQGVVTSGGTTGWQELALFLIANYGGAQRAAHTAKVWLMADRGELQAPYASTLRATPHGDKAVDAAQVWIANHYRRDTPVTEMAAVTGLSPTSFARRFRKATGQTPLEYVQALRIEEARQMLEASETAVADIAEEVGYSDTASFRRLFKRRTGLTPAEHRRMFGRARFGRYTQNE